MMPTSDRTGVASLHRYYRPRFLRNSTGQLEPITFDRLSKSFCEQVAVRPWLPDSPGPLESNSDGRHPMRGHSPRVPTKVVPRFGGWHHFPGREASRSTVLTRPRRATPRCDLASTDPLSPPATSVHRARSAGDSHACQRDRPTATWNSPTRSSWPSCRQCEWETGAWHLPPSFSRSQSLVQRLSPEKWGRERFSGTRGSSARGHEFLTCGIDAGDTDKLKTCRHGGQHTPCHKNRSRPHFYGSETTSPPARLVSDCSSSTGMPSDTGRTPPSPAST
jgi:hypothetical protein